MFKEAWKLSAAKAIVKRRLPVRNPSEQIKFSFLQIVRANAVK